MFLKVLVMLMLFAGSGAYGACVDSVPYAKYAGFYLEAQHLPDLPNQPSFPSTELKPGKTLRLETVFTFGVEK